MSIGMRYDEQIAIVCEYFSNTTECFQAHSTVSDQ